VVIASYSGAFHKVAVMTRDTVYVENRKSFNWNEDSLKPGVRIFNDIRTSHDGMAFADYLRLLGRKRAQCSGAEKTEMHNVETLTIACYSTI
jgi:hypothetical protein